MSDTKLTRQELDELEFEQPIIMQNVDFKHMELAEKYQRGMWFMRFLVLFPIISSIINWFLGTSGIIMLVLNVLWCVFLYRGVMWIRVLSALHYLWQAYLLYQIYLILFLLVGLPFAGIAIPFMVFALASPFLLFFNSSIVHFLTVQRQENYGR